MKKLRFLSVILTIMNRRYCFVWSSYSYMEHIVSKWDEMGVLKRVLEKKLIFIETKVKCMIRVGGFHGIFLMRGCYVFHPSLFMSLYQTWTDWRRVL